MARAQKEVDWHLTMTRRRPSASLVLLAAQIGDDHPVLGVEVGSGAFRVEGDVRDDRQAIQQRRFVGARPVGSGNWLAREFRGLFRRRH